MTYYRTEFAHYLYFNLRGGRWCFRFFPKLNRFSKDKRWLALWKVGNRKKIKGHWENVSIFRWRKQDITCIFQRSYSFRILPKFSWSMHAVAVFWLFWSGGVFWKRRESA